MSAPAVDCWIAFGSNLGPRQDLLEGAMAALAAWPGLELVARSTWRETEPVGGPPAQPRFLNGVGRFRSGRTAREVLAILQELELRAGRDRSREVPNGPRRLDLDLLLHGGERSVEPDLWLPHPRLEEREFVLAPLAEIDPELRLPSGARAAERLEQLREKQRERQRELSRGPRRFDDPAQAAAWCDVQRARGRRLGFVPTMGALHGGHLALVRRAVAENDRAVVSVFVNPLQFGEAEDFRRYPRDFEGDARRLAAVGCAMVFTGTLEGFFPGRVAGGALGAEDLLDPGPSALGLEGEHRPGHFRGVATIVARLFDLVRPDRAYFGAKDFQQTLVVRDLARARGGPAIVVCPTERDPSGLALSSRNERLGPRERERAAGIWRALCAARARWEAGEREARALEEVLRAELEQAALEVEYAAVRDPERWTPDRPDGALERATALVAVRLDGVRLIDNLGLDRDAP